MEFKKQAAAGLIGLSILGAPYAALAESPRKAPVKWHNVNTFEAQSEKDGSLFNSENYNFTKYSKIGQQLLKIQKQSHRMTVTKYGKSANGRDMYVVTIADQKAKGQLGFYKKLRKEMFKNPEKAQVFIDKHPDVKVPVMINGSIHGTEFAGSDAVLQLIERFAKNNDADTKQILKNQILIFNVVANPDGRIDATRFNGNGIDLNRDFITQSQPETQAMVSLIKEWNPMVFLDLHGYVKDYGGPDKPGLIEPCTPPHNPNYEYDLFSNWAMNQAKAMESEIVSNRKDYKNTNTSTSKVDYQNMTGAYIPQRDDTAGWDDYPPIFTPMYAMYHGSYGYTLETPTNDWDGVKWHYDAVMGALNYASEHKTSMVKDQIEVFKRGINFDHPFHKKGFFPKAYILPSDPTDSSATEKAVSHLMKNDIEVSKSKKTFNFNGKTYPAGTYIVNMSQAKAGLANTMLWDGEDITDDTPAMYDISAWSLPELWGFDAIQVPADSNLKFSLQDVKSAHDEGKLIGKGPYKIPNTSVKSVELANKLINRGYAVQRGTDGSFYIKSRVNHDLMQFVRKSGLIVKSAAIPNQVQNVKQLHVTILKDGGMGKNQSHSGTKLALERLGFNVRELAPRDLAVQGLGNTDVFFYNGTSNLISYKNSKANAEFGLENEAQFQALKKNITDFVNGGGKYIAIGSGAASATKTLGLTNVTINKGNPDSNGIVRVDYNHSALTQGYNESDYGFVYGPVWYTNTDGYETAASFKNSSEFFMAGHWKNHQAAQGQAVIIKDQSKDVTLMGIEAGFRDHTDYLFRLLSNAVYSK
ncbi:Zinc carboxypeptidase [Bacillus sp. OV194]|nr:Zinc carboxypeptidase [Bacillus sp. OV194]